MAQEQVRRENREQEETPPPVVAPKTPETQKKNEISDEELDKLLEEVDKKLEENPAEFIKGYTQRGGE